MVTPAFVEDRMAGARWAGGKLAFSYDAQGRTAAEVIADNDGDLTVQQMTHHADGKLDTLVFRLVDRQYAPETLKYGYDSAGRVHAVDESDNSGTASLYHADIIDPRGRALHAQYGAATTLAAQYADSARRLLQSFSIQTPTGSRRIDFGGYDSLNRETQRQEFVNGAAVSAPILKWYNDVGQLASVTRQNSPLDAWKFEYDGLGNLTYLRNSDPSKDVTSSTQALDGDRICRVDYSPGLTGSECNVKYDGSGAVSDEPTRTGTRQMTYFASGLTRTIVEANVHVALGYDALDRLQSRDLQGGASTDQRRDRHFGDLVTRRDVFGTNGASVQWLRQIPGPGGVVATRRGPDSDWIFEFNEARGNRFMTTDAGTIVQDVAYTPFGEATSTGVPPDSADYTTSQWNGGDALAALGLSQLGVRIYDPVVGRFLSRDPLISPVGALGSHPYAFAMNDPINASDPTGLDCVGENCANDLPKVPSPEALVSLFFTGRTDAGPIAEPQAANPLDGQQLADPVTDNLDWSAERGTFVLGLAEHYLHSSSFGGAFSVAGHALYGVDLGLKLGIFVDKPSLMSGAHLGVSATELGLGKLAPPVGLTLEGLDTFGVGPNSILDSGEEIAADFDRVSSIYAHTAQIYDETGRIYLEAAQKYTALASEYTALASVYDQIAREANAQIRSSDARIRELDSEIQNLRLQKEYWTRTTRELIQERDRVLRKR
jgi:RHS repeat-associated protein